jgi:predicted ester cyclase
MSTEENKALVRRFIDELINRRNADICDEVLAPDIVPAAKEFVRAFYATFGDTEMTILDLVAEEEQVAMRFRTTSTHQGDFFGVAATGKRLAVEGMWLSRIVDGKIMVGPDKSYIDQLALLQQLTTVSAGGQPLPPASQGLRI